VTQAAVAALAALRLAIDDELRACGRPPGSVTLVGVAKRQPLDRVEASIRAGLADIGENYVQEAQAAFAVLPPVRKHFIGHLQTNKAGAVANLFDLVQSVDSERAGLALARAAERIGKRQAVLLQVNVSPTERFGCPPDDAPGLAETLRAQPSLLLEGVMAIGPVSDKREEISAAFALATKTFDRIGGTTLSMGMSGDWREAVRAGSTMVRVGTALFGGRMSA
jgi:pyridoxal phosphate enzyme (YggS family)